MARAEAVPMGTGRGPQKLIKFPGDYGEGEPPVPIPNTAVKPLRADGTCRATGWESRSSPGAFF